MFRSGAPGFAGEKGAGLAPLFQRGRERQGGRIVHLAVGAAGAKGEMRIRETAEEEEGLIFRLCIEKGHAPVGDPVVVVVLLRNIDTESPSATVVGLIPGQLARRIGMVLLQPFPVLAEHVRRMPADEIGGLIAVIGAWQGFPLAVPPGLPPFGGGDVVTEVSAAGLEVELAGSVRAVPRVGQGVGDGRHIGRKDTAVGQEAVLARCLAGDHRGAAGHADRVVAVAAVKVDPARRQRVDVRGLHHWVAVAAETKRLHLVNAEDEEVGGVFHLIYGLLPETWRRLPIRSETFELLFYVAHGYVL